MQKVEGSNPFSRFFENVLQVEGLVSAWGAEPKWNRPRISPPFRALVPEMTQMRGDFGIPGHPPRVRWPDDWPLVHPPGGSPSQSLPLANDSGERSLEPHLAHVH